MVLKYHISPYPTLHEAMVVNIYEAQSPNAVVWTTTIPERDANGNAVPGAGHQVPFTVTANGLDKVVHIVRLYTAVSGVLLHDYNSEANSDHVTIFDPIRFKIGDGGDTTPSANTRDYHNPLLEGVKSDDYMVFRNNYGYLFKDLHFTEIHDGFSLIAPDQFNEDEEFVVQRKPLVNTLVNDSVVGKWFGGFLDVFANKDYASADLRKLIRLHLNAEYTFPANGAIPIGYAFCFQHFGQTGTGKINFLNAPLIYNNATQTSVSVPELGFAAFVFDGANWNVIYMNVDIAAPQVKRGQILGLGSFYVGDVPAGDPAWDIVHNLNIQGDYMVQLSIQSVNASLFWKNNLICSTWWHSLTDKPNRFSVSLAETKSEGQDATICWTIIKL